jgi:hypothetical protein
MYATKSGVWVKVRRISSQPDRLWGQSCHLPRMTNDHWQLTFCYQPRGQWVYISRECRFPFRSIVFHVLWVAWNVCSSLIANSPLTDGRRPVFLVSLPFLCIGSFGTALSPNIPQLMAWRFVQAFCASPGISMGAGVVGDIYKLEEKRRVISTCYNCYNNLYSGPGYLCSGNSLTLVFSYLETCA